MLSTAANPPPAVTPMIPGSASGFRTTPCKMAPDAARQAPTMKPMRTRGRRKSMTIFSWTGWPDPVKAAIKSGSDN